MITAVQEQALYRVTLPAARTFHRGHKLGCIELVELWDGPELFVERVDAIDPPLFAPGAKVEPPFPIVRNPFGVFDDSAIHIGDPERTVGACFEHGGPEPVVAGRQKLAVCIVRPAMAAEAHALGLEHHSMHQVVYRLTDKQAGGELGTEELVAIGRRAIGRGDMVGGAGVVKPGQCTADGKQPGVGLKCRSGIR